MVRVTAVPTASLPAPNEAPSFTLKSCQSVWPLKYSCAVSTFSPASIRAATEKPYSILSSDQAVLLLLLGSLTNISYQSSHDSAAVRTSAMSAGAIARSRGNAGLSGGTG